LVMQRRKTVKQDRRLTWGQPETASGPYKMRLSQHAVCQRCANSCEPKHKEIWIMLANCERICAPFLRRPRPREWVQNKWNYLCPSEIKHAPSSFRIIDEGSDLREHRGLSLVIRVRD
jgi:hypothetical protein